MNVPLDRGSTGGAFEGHGSAVIALGLTGAIDAEVLPMDIVMADTNGPELLQTLAPLLNRRFVRIIFVPARDGESAGVPAPCMCIDAAPGPSRHSVSTKTAMTELAEIVRTLGGGPAGKPAETHIWAERGAAFVPIPYASIDWIEADRDYVRLHTGNESAILRATLSGMTKRFGADEFLRIRRSALVRLARIESVRRHGAGDYRVQLTTGRQLRIGRTYITKLRTKFQAR